MKAVIIAAGSGTRMYPLTVTTPKLLLPVLSVPLLSWFVHNLKGLVDEIVIVINDKDSGNQIRTYVHSHEFTVPIKFAVQSEQKGTAHAMQIAQEALADDDSFLVMNGDDLYSRKDIESVIAAGPGLVGTPVNDPEKWGIITRDGAGKFTGLIEKPSDAEPGSLANIGLYHFNSSIFDIYDSVPESPRGEYEITDSVSLFAKSNDFSVIESNGDWYPIGYPWHLLEVNEKLVANTSGIDTFLLEHGYTRVDQQTDLSTLETQGIKIENGTVIKDVIYVKKGTHVKAPSYFEGVSILDEDVIVGPFAYIRGTSTLGRGAKVGASEVKNAVIFSETKLPHFNYFGDGIAGNDVNFGVGSVVTNLRHDNEPVKTLIKGQLVSTGRRKFSAVIGDGVRLGAGTVIYPGRKLWPGVFTLPNSVISDDVTE
ncbi:MAG: Bifunctional protein GlmU [candidate division WS6 bacterium OLB20]|uniref:Bifunctional protein GlmU n=1 Tax=candidate division WS6 bacterium OLB20 TaxID=1617426 RepID=A0A136LXU0_9BACT|nr:MAG: Bifunctional protein GlmU [candidate division WS6 bacterium OLB20]